MLKANATQKEVDEYCESVAPSYRSHRRHIQGFGVNDLPHIVGCVDSEGKHRAHSGYSQWQSMVQRAKSEVLKLRYPTYKDVELCEEWKYASIFLNWKNSQDKEDGWHLDKDLLVFGNKVYSPNTCIFVPCWLNVFTISASKSRGEYPVGVHWKERDRVFIAQGNNPIELTNKHLGTFRTADAAHEAWREFKLYWALELKPQMDRFDLRIYENVVKIINSHTKGGK